MDRITKSLLDQFAKDNDIESQSESTSFEQFCGYLVVGGHYTDSFSPEDISVGAGADTGIDCIAILVNGSLVTEPEEISDLAETNGFLDVTFIFVQAERSASFDSAKIGQFSFGILDFIEEEPKLPQNLRVQHYAAISKEIFNNSRFFKKGNPQCFMYYVTTGKWVEDEQLTIRCNAVVQDVEGKRLFRKVKFDCFGADEIQRLYRESQNAITKEITFVKKVVVPEMEGVEEAYLGILPCTEFLKLVQTDSEEVLSSLFYDNVRHWQEWNPVNTEIKRTIESANKHLLPLLNNGVTIVAKRVNPTGDKFLIEDYQVVNGCQTSYVLHSCRDNLNEEIYLPVRLIATQNEDVRNAIIKATNRQTQVTDEQLFALAEFPKKLETFFPSFEGQKKLFYERRSRQYNGDRGVEKVRIITMTNLVRAFVAIFRDLPHRTTRNYKALLKEIGKDIFGQEHRVEPYYTAALAHFRLEFLFRNNHLRAELKPARYHILMATRLLFSTEKLPPMNSREIVRFSENMNQLLWDEQKAKDLLCEAVACVEEVAEGNFHRDNIRTEVFTNALRENIRQKTADGLRQNLTNPIFEKFKVER